MPKQDLKLNANECNKNEEMATIYMVTSTLFPSQVELLAMWVKSCHSHVTENIEREREKKSKRHEVKER